jgi:hypothetical protein
VHNAQHRNRSPSHRFVSPRTTKRSIHLLSNASTSKNKAKNYEPTNQHASFGKTSPTHKHLLHIAKSSLSEQPSVFGQNLRDGSVVLLLRAAMRRRVVVKMGFGIFQQVQLG